MSDNVTVKILGLDELQRTLEEMPRDVARKVVREDLKPAGKIVQDEMVAEAPRKSGFLAEHFGTKVTLHPGGIAGTAYVGPQGRMYYPDQGDRRNGVATGKHPVKGGAVPVASVARFLEFGTSKMEAHPFMRNAFETKKNAALEKIIAGIKAGIAKWVK